MKKNRVDKKNQTRFRYFQVISCRVGSQSNLSKKKNIGEKQKQKQRFLVLTENNFSSRPGATV